MATIFERIRKVTVEQLGVNEEEVTPSSSFVDDLGADSLDLVELIMALEEEFTTPARKISIPDEDAEKIISVQDAMDYIRDLGSPTMKCPPPRLRKSLLLNLPPPPSPRPPSAHNSRAASSPVSPRAANPAATARPVTARSSRAASSANHSSRQKRTTPAKQKRLS